MEKIYTKMNIQIKICHKFDMNWKSWIWFGWFTLWRLHVQELIFKR